MSVFLNRVRLIYFDFPGLAEPIRNALALGQIPFTDERIPATEAGYAEVSRRRSAGELGSSGVLPLLEVQPLSPSEEGVKPGRPFHISQSAAILRFVGCHARFGPDKLPLYPIDTPEAQARCDETEEALAEIRSRLLPAWYKAAQPRSLKTGKPSVLLSESQHEELLTSLNEDILPSKLGGLERMLELENLSANKNGGDMGKVPFFLGDRLSIADLSCHTLVNGLLTGGDRPEGIDGTKVLEGTPLLRTHSERVGSLHPIMTRLDRIATT